jgi:hypothetical protein
MKRHCPGKSFAPSIFRRWIVDKTNSHYMLGRVQGVIEMFDKPEIYRLTPEQALGLIREIVREYKLNREVDHG